MVDWLLKGKPRAVQVEALRRSYCGEALWDVNPDFPSAPLESVLRALPGRDGPRLGWGHFLQMRLGKTPVALNEFELYRRDHHFKRAIMFSPNKYKDAWASEAERFGLSVPALAFESSDIERAQRFVKRNSEFLLSVNYEALGYKKNLAFLEGLCGPDTFIGADESIHLKNPSGKYVTGAIPLAKLCGARRAYSGKPITQGPHDLWGQLRFIHGIEGVNPVTFRNTYCKMGGFQGKKVVGVKNEEALQTILNECSWSARRTKWLTTPGVDYAERRITLAPEQMRLYKQMQEDFLILLENGTLVTAEQIVTKLIKLQQISSGFIIDEDRKVHELVPIEQNAKAQEIKTMLDEEIEGKTIIICHHSRSILLMKQLLEKYEPAIIAGGTDAEAEKARFNSDPNCRVMIGQTKAIKYGHTLMGGMDDPCSTILVYENTYSLDDRSQLEERPQGAGQQLPIIIWDFLSTPQDAAPIRALQRKEDVAALLMRYDRSTGILPPKPELKAS